MVRIVFYLIFAGLTYLLSLLNLPPFLLVVLIIISFILINFLIFSIKNKSQANQIKEMLSKLEILVEKEITKANKKFSIEFTKILNKEIVKSSAELNIMIDKEFEKIFVKIEETIDAQFSVINAPEEVKMDTSRNLKQEIINDIKINVVRKIKLVFQEINENKHANYYINENKIHFNPKKFHYEVLEVNENSTLIEIKKSYRRLAKKYHPDVSNDPKARKKFLKIKEAWEIIKKYKKFEN